MEGSGKQIIGTVGLQLVALAIGLLTIALIVWVASKAWKKGQVESNYSNAELDGGSLESSWTNNQLYAQQNWLNY